MPKCFLALIFKLTFTKQYSAMCIRLSRFIQYFRFIVHNMRNSKMEQGKKWAEKHLKI